MQLIPTLVSQLGINEEQARGGAGLLFQAAQEKLDAEDFQKLTNHIPEITQLMEAAPPRGGLEEDLKDSLACWKIHQVSILESELIV